MIFHIFTGVGPLLCVDKTYPTMGEIDENTEFHGVILYIYRPEKSVFGYVIFAL